MSAGRSKKEGGFTLIELLIVVAVLGILAAIALPQFANYRTKSYNSAAQADCRNSNIHFEAFLSEKFNYPY